MAAFDFAFGLRGGSVAQGDAIEVEGSAQLGKSIRGVGEKERVIVHIERQWQAVDGEYAREKIQVCQQSFGRIKTSPGIIASGIIENIQENLFIGSARQPAVRRGVVLPKGTPITGLPAFYRPGLGFEASIRGQMVLDGPATNTGTAGLELESTQQFAGRSAVGRWWLRGKQFSEQLVYG